MNKICPNCGTDNSYENSSCEICESNLNLNDKYYLIKVLGEGNQITYLAQDLSQNSVIIKEFSISSLDEWKQEELFKREIVALKSLNHKQIPKLIDDFKIVYKKDKTYYLVMEFIDGTSLKDKINKIYSEDDILQLIEELIVILEYLHSFNPPIIHRDIKPSNIILDKNNRLNLIDFGAVTDILKPEGGSTIVGTYGYMAPEQFMGRATVQSDYYSLGAIIIKLLTKEELDQIIDITDLSFVNKLNVSNKMKVVLINLLSVDLSKRVKSTDEILNLIKSYRDNTLDITQIDLIEKNRIEAVDLKDLKRVRKKQEVKKKQNLRKELRDFKRKYEEIDFIIRNPKLFITCKDSSLELGTRYIMDNPKLFKNYPQNERAEVTFVDYFTLEDYIKMFAFLFLGVILMLPILDNENLKLLLYPIIGGMIFGIMNFSNSREKSYQYKDLKDKELLYVVLKYNHINNSFIKKRKLDKGKILFYEKLLKEMKS